MMIRRRVVALISALLMLTIGAVSIGTFVAATQSERGREWIRRAVEAQLSRSVAGRVHVGTLSGSFLTDLRIDSLAVADVDDSVFIASGPLSLTFDPRDLADGRLIIRSLVAERPTVTMRRDHAGIWTNQKLWPRRGPRTQLRRTGFGAVFVIEQAEVRGGEFVLMMPWTPPELAAGASRDSLIAAERSRAGREVAVDASGRPTKVWRWREIHAAAPRLRLAYPDSAGAHIQVAQMSVVESDPPFVFHELAGDVRIRNDSLWLDFPTFRLPGSVGAGRGTISWAAGPPLRYAIRIESDSVSLADVAWISDAIPTTGGGRMRLDIRNATANPRVIDYAISSMDVRSHRSRLRGRMTWGVGGTVLALRDVDLEATPLDVALLERFNGGPFPVPLRGRFTGRIRASGGPVDRFQVEGFDARFTDDNVEGATAQASAQGELDIREIGRTVFRGVDLTLTHFDLRTAQALDPAFPRLNGTLRGTARLDSSWLDVRLSDADVTHRDGDSPESRLRGTARIDWAEGPIVYELDATALPLSFSALARSFVAFPLRGEYSGPLRVNGEMSDLLVAADLVGEAGRLEADVRLDVDAPGYRLTGRSTLTAVDPRRLFGREDVPAGEVTARMTVNVRGDSLADLVGEAAVTLDRSIFADARIFAGETRLRFGEGRVVAETLFVESSAVDVAAAGALGLSGARRDTLALRVRADSLGGLRAWIPGATSDSLAGRIFVEAQATGWLRSFDLDATATASGLLARGNSAAAVRARASAVGLPSRLEGSLSADGDTLQLARFGIVSARVDAVRNGNERTAIQVAATGNSGTALRAGGSFEGRDDSLRVRIDSLSLLTAQHRWSLGEPARFALAAGGFRVDSVDLRAGGESRVTLAGRLAGAGALDVRANARSVPLADIGELFQLPSVTEGHFDLQGRLAGTRAAPRLEAAGEMRNALVRGLRLDTLRAEVVAAADQVQLKVGLGSRARPALTAEGILPLTLGLDGAGVGMRSEGAVSGRIRADSLGLEVLESLTRDATGARGSLSLAVDVSGTWGRPFLDGTMRVRNGSLAPGSLGNVRWRGVEADLVFIRDSIAVQRVVAQSGADRRGRAEITGWVSMRELSDPLLNFRLTGRNFHAFAQPGVADVDLSGEMRLTGSWRSAILRGDLTADRGEIAIPELTSKDVISLDDPDRFGSIDTTRLTELRGLPTAPPAFIENLTIPFLPVRMGQEVWLRSSEANINLGGQVNITRGRVTRGRNEGQLQLALDGPLQTVRGTYRLNLGPVQRTFEVEGGEIRFFGDADLNPTLDISALHTVRQYSAQGVRPDVRVRVHLGGTLLQPTAQLSTPDSVRVTNSDLISYLVTGGPSFEIGGRNGDLSSTALSVVLGSFGSVIGGKATGSLCDDANLSTAGLDAYGGPIKQVGGGVLSGIRFNCARQIGDRAFVRLDAGLCQVGQLMTQPSGSDPLSFADALGVKLDYLLGPGLTASVGVEPPTSAVLCSQNANASARGFVPTPRQVGFDIFRVWRF
jgi:translocation and assembly module TamB